MSASTCPQCSTPLEAGAVLCPKCDLILDTSFLGGDILDADLNAPASAPPVDEESYVSMFAEETGFLTSPTSEMSRTVFPVGHEHTPSIQAMLEDASVVEQTGSLAPSALSDLERHVLALSNGERPVARIRTLVTAEDAHVDALDVQGALISLAEKNLIRQAGVARKEGAAASPEGPTRAVDFSEAPTLAFPSQDQPPPPAVMENVASAPPPGDDVRPAFEVDDAPPDWLDGPTNLDLRGAGLDEDDLESSSEEPSAEMAPSALVSVEAGASGPPKVETMVFETNAAFLAGEKVAEADDDAPPATHPFDKSVALQGALSAEADAIFASTPQTSPKDEFGEPTLQLESDLQPRPDGSGVSGQTHDDSSASDSLELSVDLAEDLEAKLADNGGVIAQDTNESISLSDSGFDDDAEVTRGDVEGAIALGSTPPARPEVTNEAADPEETAMLSERTPDDEGASGESAHAQAQRAFDLAMADLKAGRTGRARSFARVAQKLVPSSALYAAVIDHWTQVAARASAGFADPLPDEMRLFIEAQEQDAQKNAEGAIALVEQAIAVAPDNAQLHNYLGVLFAGRLQDAERALKPLMKAVELAPDHSGFRENLARVLAMGQPEHQKAPLPQTQRLADPKSAN